MSQVSTASTAPLDNPICKARSNFTYRDLRDLSNSQALCPLRVIALVDFDAFYAQCESVRLGLSPDKPLAVQQWNALIAVNYAAKAAGVKRLVAPDEAKSICPDIVLQHVATWREGDTNWAYREDVRQHMKTDKAALDPYRLQSRKALELIKSRSPRCQRVERASIDEVFLDLSAQVHNLLLHRFPCLRNGIREAALESHLPCPPTSDLAWQSDRVVAGTDEPDLGPADWDDVALNIGSEIIRGIRKAIYDELRYTTSAGIARNKTLAKLAAGHHKPNQQTVVRARAIIPFYSGYKFTKIRGLGGKLGRRVNDAFNTDEIQELLKVSLSDMRHSLGPGAGTWVFDVVRGNEYEEVVERTRLQSMLAAKTFVPKAENLQQAEKWLHILIGDLVGRLQEQDTKQRPHVITLNHAINGRFGPTRSKQMQIPTTVHLDNKLLFDLSLTLLKRISQEGPTWPCLGMSIQISDFEDISTSDRQLTSFFAVRGRTAGVVPKAAFIVDHKHEPHSVNVDRKRKRILEPDDPAADNLERKGGKLGCFYHCPKCGRDIGDAEVLEHLDWHVAEELQDS